MEAMAVIRALAFAALVGGATWASNIYDRYIRTTERKPK